MAGPLVILTYLFYLLCKPMDWFLYDNGLRNERVHRLNGFSVTIPCYKDAYVNNLFLRTARFWHSLPAEYFPLTYDLNGCKSKVNRHLNFGFFLNSFPIYAFHLSFLFLVTLTL